MTEGNFEKLEDGKYKHMLGDQSYIMFDFVGGSFVNDNQEVVALSPCVTLKSSYDKVKLNFIEAYTLSKVVADAGILENLKEFAQIEFKARAQMLGFTVDE